ncbi:TetR/AcrR family transcriptional regulator [Rhodococcus sp. 06-156-3C]|uniref:TetR/AcrR family transcriptional regulator n=1 Tax=Nocardiaceae TaxID=85025 RepID=UPI000522FAF2|nr:MULTISPECIES: TetR/AcrR family transcriptional regulator [Rhodococcus]OZD18167.1 TetR/AcrR family transcriptional regulator [Rhodococcus sp. 06-156-4C]OZD18764.1 TetR/AcrR family transcriptional regulator [Rhodococcus sp. 06-156-3C]OZD22274.1 TetR/AcrR family transcriptional regulator [Rhodococcus sp. 06-156-4a]OZD34080.1 TetR/AcrR family transcriptional regulator [Rhodococcus sp. 06-156-3b]OZD38817.1 TetR/AcrR family transcriptional regulator [Rhodococcus sp. 06-156-3]
MTDLARSLSISAVVDDAGLSHQTFHNTYRGNSRSGGSGGKEAFVADLLDNLTVNYTGIDIAQGTTQGSRESLSPVSALFDDLTSGLMRRRLIAVLLAVDHDGARKAVTPEFERLDADFRAVVGRAIQSQGGSVRQPLTLTTLSTVLAALLDGLALREMLTPGSVPSRDVAAATASILRWAIDPIHSDRTTPPPDSHDDIDALDPLRPDIEADVIAATETLFADNGYFLVTLADIAASARIRVDDLRRLFPSKIDIIVAALKPEFDRVHRLRRADERLGVEPTVALRRTLIALGEFVIGNRAMSSGMLLALSFEQFQQPSTITTVLENLYLPSAVVPILEQGRRTGEFLDEAPTIEVAIMLTNNVLFRCLTRPNEAAVDVVDGVLRVLMPGVEARTR